VNPQHNPDLIMPAEAVTLDGLFRERIRRNPDATAYRYFDAAAGGWQSMSWSEMGSIVSRWRAALQGEALSPGDRVALMLPNCCEWVQFEQAALGLGLVVVPLYVNDRAANIAFILEQTQSRILLIEDSDQWQSLRGELKTLSSLKHVIVLGQVQDDDSRLVTLKDWLPDASSELQYR